MNMQDNEIDELFRSRLSGLEMEPSAQVWDNISAQIGSKKRTLVPILSIAATILLMLAAGTWFLLDRPAKVEQQQVVKQKPAQSSNSIKDVQPVAKQTIGNAATQPKQVVNEMAKANRLHSKRKSFEKPAAQTIEPTLASEEKPEPLLAAVPVKPLLQPVLPDGQLSIRTIDTAPAAIKPLSPAPAVMAANKPIQKKRHGIHSLGDLINVVVAKVDKREDKLIEFTETDEDANITGINLGIFRVKKENPDNKENK